MRRPAQARARDRVVQLAANDLVLGEDDLHASRLRRDGHEVDRRRLDLHEKDVGVCSFEVLAEPARLARLRDTLTTSASRWSVGARAGGEHRDAPSRQRRDRAQTELRFEDRDLLQRADRSDIAPTDEHHEIRDEHAVRVEVRKRIVPSAADENSRVDVDRRDRRAAAVEDDDVRLALRRKGCTLRGRSMS